MTKAHICHYRVYYEDTDAAGIVYYANYLKFAERARTEWLRELGFEQGRLLADGRMGFVVRHVEADFLAPARLDDLLDVETRLQEAGKVRMRMQQVIRRAETVLARLDVTIACINGKGKPAKLPENILAAIEVAY